MKISDHKLWRLIFSLTVISFLLSVSFRCKSKTGQEAIAEEKGEVEILSLDMLYPIFGRGEENSSGIYEVSQADTEVSISYRYVPVDPNKIYEEIGRDLALKIRNFYEKFPEVDKTVLSVYVPTSEELGWKKYVSFEMTRKIFKEVEWTDLMQIDLLRVAENVNYYD
jgi:hypothetical protein